MTDAVEETVEINKRYSSGYPHGRPPGLERSFSVRMADTESIKIAAVGIINSHGQVLVGFNSKRFVWDIPQGVVESNETVAEAAVREVYEEINLVLDSEQLIKVSEFSNLTDEFIYPWTTELFILKPNIDLSLIINREPQKCTHLLWVAPCQLPVPRGLSLRVLLSLLGKA